MYELIYTGQFKKSLKRCAKRGLDIQLMKDVLDELKNTGRLDPKYKPHTLVGNFSGCWECHIQSDWLLIWRQDNDKMIIITVDTGTHSDLY